MVIFAMLYEKAVCFFLLFILLLSLKYTGKEEREGSTNAP